MKLLYQMRHQGKANPATVAVIGNFDGVHRGHQALLAAARALATRLALPLLVIVFEPQTREFFLKDKAPPRLSSLRQKIKILRQFGVDDVCCLRFNRQMAQMDATAFAQWVIFSQLQVKHLLVGDDFRFGCDRLGDVRLLAALGSAQQVQVEVYPDVLEGTERISSTLVRQALQQDRLDEAAQLLGRSYSFCGRVIYGDGRGRQWGVPTANLKLGLGPLLLRGVFCVEVICQDGQQYHGVANVGNRPTVDGTKSLLEVHLLGFDGSLYGQRIEVVFRHKLRQEAKFSSKDSLLAQIHADVAAAKIYFLER